MAQSNAAASSADSAALPAASRAEAAVSADASLENGTGWASSYCPRCSARLASRSCKLICPGCGYYMSCSDFI
jgi:hypothetical protein